jgi:hypothetical protein
LDHAHEQSTQDVDGRDQQARDGVATDELRGTVHRAVEIRLLGHLLATPLRFGVVDQTGAQVAVDAHLTPRHGIEREPSRHLRHPPRALGDDDEVDAHQDQEDHDANGVVAPDHELAERFDDSARVTLPEDQAGGADVEGEPVERQQEQ